MSINVHEAFSLDSFQDRLLFWDDFEGDQIKDEWDITLIAGGTAAIIDAQAGGVMRWATPAAADRIIMDWDDIRSLLVSRKVTIEVRAIIDVNNTDRYVEFGLTGAGGYILMRMSGVGNILIRTNDGVSTTGNSDQAVDTNYHIFRIECHTHGGNHVHFYFDGSELNVSPLSTNVPAGHLQPRFDSLNLGGVGGAVNVDVDYVYVRQER